MSVTLGNLLLLINEKEKEINDLNYEILRNSTITIDREVDGSETVLNKVEDFDILMLKYGKLTDELNTYKKVLAHTNANTLLESKISIIDGINKISTLKKELNLLESLCSKKPSLDRRFDGSGSSSYYRVIELNFDMQEARDFRDRLKDLISKLESEIQTTNATTYVEV